VVAERLGDREDTVLKLYGHITPRGRVAAVASVGSWWSDPAAARDATEIDELRATVERLRGELAAAQREQSVSEVLTP
jgi:hypothetical protein